MKRISDRKLKELDGKIPFSSISKRSPIRKKPRTKAERERIYGPKGYVEWIHDENCVGCGVAGYSECAHVGTGGVGRKADWTETVPLCGPHFRGYRMSHPVGGCHPSLHQWGRETFEEIMCVDLSEEVRKNHSRWLAFSGSPE